MKKITKLFTVLLSAALLFSCNNGFNLSDLNNDEAIQNGDKAKIILNIEDSTERTVFAPVTVSNFSNIKVEYKKAGTDDFATLVSYTNVASISTAEPVYVTPDTYDFQVSANASGFIYKAEKTGVALVKGNNTLNVELVLTNMETPFGTGDFTLTLTVPNQQVSNYANLSVMKNGVVLADYEAIPCSLTDEADNKVKVVAKSVEGKALASGMYDVVIRVYADENKLFEVTNLEDSVQIVDGLNTVKEYTKNNLYINESNLQFGTIGNNSYVICNKVISIGGTGELELTAEQTALVDAGTNPFEGVFEEDIEEVYIGDEITAICESFFYKSTVKKVKGGKGLETIGDYAFSECQALKELPAFDKVTVIGTRAFCECSSLEELSGFNKVETIGYAAFYKCAALKKINGFNKLTVTNYNTFTDCTALEEVNGFDALPVIKDNTFYGCTNLKKLPAFASVTKICSMAFKDCTALEELPAFANVTELGNCAFQGCTGLKYVGKIKHSEDDVEVSVFDNVTTIGQMLFYNCNAIEEINGFNALTGSAFPSGIKTSGFESSKLKYVKGFNSLTKIPENVFESNKLLKSIAGFTNVTTIGKEAFRHCDALTEIPAFEKVTNIDMYAFIYCVSLTEINGFNAVKTIGNQGFACCAALESVSGFASLEKIGEKAFMSCTNLTSFDFASNSYEIESGAFRNCTGFTEIIIPAEVSAIGYDAFSFNKASSITVLNPNINISSDANNVFASGTITDGGENIFDFEGTFYFAGSETQWKKVLGWDGTDADWNYSVNLGRVGIGSFTEFVFDYYPHEHVWVLDEESSLPTLASSGLEVHECSICHKMDYKTLPALYSVPSDVNGNPLTSVNVGDIVYLGSYPQTLAEEKPANVTAPGRFSSNPYYVADDGECYALKIVGSEEYYFHVEPIAWKVVATDYENDGKVLLISEKILENGYSHSGLSYFSESFSSKAFAGSSGSGGGNIFLGPAFPGGGMGGNEGPIDAYNLFLTKTQVTELLGTENAKKTCTAYASFEFDESLSNSNNNCNTWWLDFEDEDYVTVKILYVNENGEICNEGEMSDDDIYNFHCGIAPSVTYQF